MREAHHPYGFHRCQRCLETNNMSPKNTHNSTNNFSNPQITHIVCYKHKVIFM